MRNLIIYKVPAAVWTDYHLTNNALLGVQKILETACTIVTYAPMLSIIFCAALMRDIQLTLSVTAKQKMPLPWAQTATLCCVRAVLAQVAIVLIIPVLTRDRRSPRTSTVTLTCPTGERRDRRTILLAARYITMLMTMPKVVDVLSLESEAARVAIEEAQRQRFEQQAAAERRKEDAAQQSGASRRRDFEQQRLAERQLLEEVAQQVRLEGLE